MPPSLRKVIPEDGSRSRMYALLDPTVNSNWVLFVEREPVGDGVEFHPDPSENGSALGCQTMRT